MKRKLYCSMNRVVTALIFVLGASTAHAVEVAAGVNISSLGPGASVTFGINDRFNARLGYNAADIDETFTEDGITYDADLDIGGTSLLVDWHVTGGTFRVTGGIILNDIELNANALLSGPVDIGGTTFTPTQVGSLRGSIDFDSTAPYIGVGWGNAVASGKGFSFAADLGLMYTGEADVELTQVGGTVAIPQANIDAEEANVENELDDYEFYPILRVGVAYRF